MFENNFPQVVMTHAVSAIAAYYEKVLELFDSCAIPVLKGHPVSGKTTCLKAALSPFEISSFLSDECLCLVAVLINFCSSYRLLAVPCSIPG